MTPVERLQAAIEKLEQAKEATAHWHAIGGASEWLMLLWRTIDAQLAILHLAVEYGDLPNGQGSRFSASAGALADAILGSDS